MKSDFEFFVRYFRGIDAEEIRTMDLLEKIRHWDQEIDSTLDLNEKAGFQDQIVGILEAFFTDFPGNTNLRKTFALALNNRAWLKLCEGAVSEARDLLGRAGEQGVDLPAMACNLAHCDLLEGSFGKALEAYRALETKRNESNKDFREVVREDLKKLNSCNLLTPEVLGMLEESGILKPAS
jgi:hypothetical protein